MKELKKGKIISKILNNEITVDELAEIVMEYNKLKDLIDNARRIEESNHMLKQQVEKLKQELQNQTNSNRVVKSEIKNETDERFLQHYVIVKDDLPIDVVSIKSELKPSVNDIVSLDINNKTTVYKVLKVVNNFEIKKRVNLVKSVLTVYIEEMGEM